MDPLTTEARSHPFLVLALIEDSVEVDRETDKAWIVVTVINFVIV